MAPRLKRPGKALRGGNFFDLVLIRGRHVAAPAERDQ